MSETFQPGFGAQLRAARESRELTVAKVAEKLKLTPRQIEAMEEEDLSLLPGAVFVRGFIRNYARLVGVDPESLIPPVDAEAAVSETITAPSEGVRFASSGVRRWVLLPLLGLAGFVALVALLYHWLRQGEDALLTAPAEQVAQAPASQAPGTQTLTLPAPVAQPQILPPAPTAATVEALASPVAEGASAAPAPVPVPAAPTPALAPAAVPPLPPVVATQAPVASPLPPVPGPEAVPAGKHSLRFEPSTDAWIQVVDAKGKRFSKLVQAGSVEVFAGDTPFRLVVGEAAQVRLSFDGHKIDLAPFIGEKVARLTLE